MDFQQSKYKESVIMKEGSLSTNVRILDCEATIIDRILVLRGPI
jgi:hypothetical protein